MQRSFITEAIMLAIYGQMLAPSRPVHYILPHSSLMELHDLVDNQEPIMDHQEEDQRIRNNIQELIRYMEEPLNKKKIERALLSPWKKSPTLLVNEQVSLAVVYAMENAEYGEAFDPIETDLILLSLREKTPILTDQLEFIQKVINGRVPVEVFDIEDYEYALEEGPRFL